MDQTRAGFLHVLVEALFSPPWRRDRAARRTGMPSPDDVRMHERHRVTDDRERRARVRSRPWSALRTRHRHSGAAKAYDAFVLTKSGGLDIAKRDGRRQEEGANQ